MTIPIWYPSPNFGYPQGSPGRNGHRPKAVIHHIAQGYCSGLMAQAEKPGSPITHYAVCRDGRVLQFVREEDSAWGNGVLNNPDRSIPWIDYCVTSGTNPNLLTISIEHEGFSGVSLTLEQEAASIELTRQICARWGLTPDREGLTGHFSLDSVNRKNCPGPAHPWEAIRTALYSGLTDIQRESLYASLTTIYKGTVDAGQYATTDPDEADRSEIFRRMNAIKIRYGLENGP